MCTLHFHSRIIPNYRDYHRDQLTRNFLGEVRTLIRKLRALSQFAEICLVLFPNPRLPIPGPQWRPLRTPLVFVLPPQTLEVFFQLHAKLLKRGSSMSLFNVIED